VGQALHPFLSPHAQVRMQQRAISAEALERLLRNFAVLGGNGVVVTVGHRYRRVRWP